MSKEELLNYLREMRNKIIEEKEKGAIILFVDEAVFSPNTSMSKCWSAPGINISIPDWRKSIKTCSIIAAISEERGVEGFLI